MISTRNEPGNGTNSLLFLQIYSVLWWQQEIAFPVVWSKKKKRQTGKVCISLTSKIENALKTMWNFILSARVKLSVNGVNTTINWKCISSHRFIDHIPFVSSVHKAPRWFSKAFSKPAVMVICCLRLSFMRSTFSLRSTWWLLTLLVDFMMKSNKADAWKRNKPFP